MAVLGMAWSCGGEAPVPAAGERAGMLPAGAASDFFVSRVIGDPIAGDERPRISHVEIADLDRDGLPDVLVCDALKNRLSWIRQVSKGTFSETTVADIQAPAHVQAIDVDGD